MAVRRSLTWLVLLALLLSGCGAETRDLARHPAPAPSASKSAEVLVSCFGEGGGWPPSATVDGIDASVSDADIREGFRQLLADPDFSGELELSFLRDGAEDTKFHVLKEDGPTLTLALGHWTAAGPDPGGYVMGMTHGAAGWTFSGGGSCPQLGPSLPSEDDHWLELSALHQKIDRESTEVPIGVSETECTGGRDPLPYLNEPEIVETEKSVTVYWTSSTGSATGYAACIGNPVTATTLHLDQPLGDRLLLDGSVYPPKPIR